MTKTNATYDNDIRKENIKINICCDCALNFSAIDRRIVEERERKKKMYRYTKKP